MEAQESGIVRLRLIVGCTLGCRLVEIEVPPDDIVACRKCGCEVLVAIHPYLALGGCAVVLPVGESKYAVAHSGELDVSAFLVIVYAVDDIPLGGIEHLVHVGSTFERQVKGIDIVPVIIGYKLGVCHNLEPVRIGLGDDIARAIGPVGEMIAEILGSRDGELCPLVKLVSGRRA